MGLFDVHAHLTHPKLRAQETAILERAAQAGLSTIISNGLNPDDNARVRDLAARSPLVRPAYGFYPVDTVLLEMTRRGIDYPRDDEPVEPEAGVASVRELAGEAFAIGEIGLDGHWVPEPLWEAQERVFRDLVAIALEHDKPIIIHTRKREAHCFEILQEMGATRVDWHCFGGRVKLARRIAEHGHFLSIPANVAKHEAFTRMVETLPRDRLLLETDCPYLSPDRSVDNEPAFVRTAAEFMAQTWGIDLDAVQAQLAQNFTTLFGSPP
ncbi:MAG: TatD family hydrolase [Polyangiaceae bacterium]